MTQRDPSKQLAKEIADLRREVRSGASSSQMRFRALQGGAIPVYDDTGSLRGEIGQLPDGTTGFLTVNGPKPVAPSNPILFPLIGGLEVTWDGGTFDGSPLPGDFRAVEVHASPYAVYTPDETTLRANLIAAGTITLQLPAQPWTITFVIRTTAGVKSDPSLGATETPEHAPTAAEIEGVRTAAATAQTAAEAADARALAAAGIAASKGTVYTQPTPPGADANGLWIDTDNGNLPHRWDGTNNVWVAVRDAGIQAAANAAAAAQERADDAMTEAQSATQKADQALLDAEAAAISADGKNMVFWRASSNPPPAPRIAGDLWFVTDLGNRPRIWSTSVTPAAWQDATFQDGAIAGLNVGKLTTGQLAVGQRIIAGLINGTHAEMTSDGFKVFANDPTDGVPDVVVAMGTSSDDFFGVTDRNGSLLASIDSTGDGNFQTVSANDVIVFGRPVRSLLDENGRGQIGMFQANPPGRPEMGGNYGPIRDRVGVAEVNAYLVAGRQYRITAGYTWAYYDGPAGANCEHRAQFTYTGPSSAGSNTAADPLVGSPAISQQIIPGVVQTGWQGEFIEASFSPTTTGRHRFLFSIEKGAGDPDCNVFLIGAMPVTLRIEDLGLTSTAAGSLSQGGGTFYQGPPPPPPPPPTQSYYVDLGPAGRRAWGGGGNVIGNGTDVYQGYESYNGNTKGMFWFDLPPITGTVDRVDVYLYFRHWWYNSGGRVLMNISDQRGVNANFYKFRGDWEPNVTVSKPGSLTVTVPGDWFPFFKGTNNDNYNGRATCITLGPGPGTNQTYYGVATDARLRIWYTQ